MNDRDIFSADPPALFSRESTTDILTFTPKFTIETDTTMHYQPIILWIPKQLTNTNTKHHTYYPITGRRLSRKLFRILGVSTPRTTAHSALVAAKAIPRKSAHDQQVGNRR